MIMFYLLSFYHFFPVHDLEQLQLTLSHHLTSQGMLGTILLAPEGINGTIMGSSPEQIANFHELLTTLLPVRDFICNLTQSIQPPFDKMRVKIKQEIISMRRAYVGLVSKNQLDVPAWNALLAHPQALILDARNKYEVSIGTFKHAATLPITNFSEFPDQFRAQYGHLPKDTIIGTFCTGGVRCEKTTAFLAEEGFHNVYHLKGGILAYLKQVPAAQNQWGGQCYLFDKRVSLTADLQLGDYVQCFACRQPVAHAELTAADYEAGVSCAACIDNPRINREKLVARTKLRAQLKRQAQCLALVCHPENQLK